MMPDTIDVARRPKQLSVVTSETNGQSNGAHIANGTGKRKRDLDDADLEDQLKKRGKVMEESINGADGPFLVEDDGSNGAIVIDDN